MVYWKNDTLIKNDNLLYSQEEQDAANKLVGDSKAKYVVGNTFVMEKLDSMSLLDYLIDHNKTEMAFDPRGDSFNYPPWKKFINELSELWKQVDTCNDTLCGMIQVLYRGEVFIISPRKVIHVQTPTIIQKECQQRKLNKTLCKHKFYP